MGPFMSFIKDIVFVFTDNIKKNNLIKLIKVITDKRSLLHRGVFSIPRKGGPFFIDFQKIENKKKFDHHFLTSRNGVEVMNVLYGFPQ
jgi:hypothetical protein